METLNVTHRAPERMRGPSDHTLVHEPPEKTKQHPPPAPMLEPEVTSHRLESCVPSPKTDNKGTLLETLYTSQPSAQPDPVRREYRKGPQGTYSESFSRI